MGLLIFIIAYILIGCIVDLLITKGEQKPNVVMVTIWPLFLIISIILVISEILEDKR